MIQRSSPSVWFQDLPSPWGTAKLKHLASFQSGDGITAHSIDSEGEYPVYGGNGLRGYTSSYTHNGEYILVGRQGALCGNVNYASGKFWASEHAVVVTPRPTVCLRWLGELLLAMDLGQYSQSAAQPGLSVEYIVNLPVPVPSLPEQRAIAAFLDRKTAEIDAVIGKKERLIALLQEERQALISRAVTRGLDAGVAMKDSGIPWLGEVPKHWTISKPKHLATKIVDGVHSTPDYVLEGIPFVTVKNLTAGLGISFDDVKYISPADHVEFFKRANPEAGDILITKDGTLGTVRIITDGRPFSIFVSVALVKPRHEAVVSRFFAYALESQTTLQQFQARQLGSALKHIHLVELKNVCIPIPPVAEQHVICEHLDLVTTRIDGLIRMNSDQIAKLREYRQALISAAVMGKLAVPQEVAT